MRRETTNAPLNAVERLVQPPFSLGAVSWRRGRTTACAILVVEDEALLSQQLSAALSEAGYAVDCAADGERADFLGQTERYDAVVLDLGLPKIGRPDACCGAGARPGSRCRCSS